MSTLSQSALMPGASRPAAGRDLSTSTIPVDSGSPAVRRVEIQHRPGGNDAGRIEVPMAAVVVRLVFVD
jgi:hypothetical protein